MEFIKQNNLQIEYTDEPKIVSIRSDVEVAHVTMYSKPYSIDIHTDYPDKGLEKLMLQLFCKRHALPETTLIYVDADASNGFWKEVGFEENRHYSSNLTEGSGYELVIEYGKLIKWATA